MELLIMSAVKAVASWVDRQLHTDNTTREIREGNKNELFRVKEKETGVKHYYSTLINVISINQPLRILMHNGDSVKA